MKFCYQCGICTASCPIAKFIGIYRPNKILELAKLGIRGLPHSSAFLFCSACTLCTKGCPQGVKVHEIMQALKNMAPSDSGADAFLADGFDDVLEALGQGMPFPVTYSWVCLHPAEGDWEPAVRTTFERSLANPVQPVEAAAGAQRVAVIGSGPAGLTAAWELARAGLQVTVFESQAQLGGMMKLGIPAYRLPKDIVDAEITKIKAMGVEMRTNTAVDQAFFDSLRSDYDAVFVATGAFRSRALRLEGEDLQGVVPALDFLKEYNLTGKAQVGKKVIVIGGGNVAADAAGTALRCGAESVKLFCLEDRKSMPAHEWEIDEAAAAGVELHPAWGPRALLGDGKKVTGVEFVQCTAVFDADKRFNPSFNEKKTLTEEADMVITAIGQAPDLNFLSAGIETVRGAIEVDPYTMETSLPHVFAGGDAAATTSLAEAIFTGKTAAESILRDLEGRAVA